MYVVGQFLQLFRSVGPDHFKCLIHIESACGLEGHHLEVFLEEVGNGR
jgi:hypothetical protein